MSLPGQGVTGAGSGGSKVKMRKSGANEKGITGIKEERTRVTKGTVLFCANRLKAFRVCLFIFYRQFAKNACKNTEISKVFNPRF